MSMRALLEVMLNMWMPGSHLSRSDYLGSSHSRLKGNGQGHNSFLLYLFPDGSNNVLCDRAFCVSWLAERLLVLKSRAVPSDKRGRVAKQGNYILRVRSKVAVQELQGLAVGICWSSQQDLGIFRTDT